MQTQKRQVVHEIENWLSWRFSDKECTCSAGDVGSVPGWGRSPAEENGNQLQYSCLRNPMDRGAWRATVHGRKESDTTEKLKNANMNQKIRFITTLFFFTVKSSLFRELHIPQAECSPSQKGRVARTFLLSDLFFIMGEGHSVCNH